MNAYLLQPLSFPEDRWVLSLQLPNIAINQVNQTCICNCQQWINHTCKCNPEKTFIERKLTNRVESKCSSELEHWISVLISQLCDQFHPKSLFWQKLDECKIQIVTSIYRDQYEKLGKVKRREKKHRNNSDQSF